MDIVMIISDMVLIIRCKNTQKVALHLRENVAEKSLARAFVAYGVGEMVWICLNKVVILCQI